MTKDRKRLSNFKGAGHWMGDVTILMRFGLTMALSIGVFFYIGFRLDKWLETKGIFTVILTIYGVVGGARYIYRHVTKMYEEDKQDDGPG